MTSNDTANEHEIEAMRRCHDLAIQGLGRVAPNPMVGAVILRDGRPIGEGYHTAFGEAHAEVAAIKAAGNVEGATLVVNLEPCSHWGKTPPCTGLIIASGIRRVVAGCTDESEKVGGRGFEALRAAGVEVVTGVLEKESIQLNRRFFTFHRRERPYIILKWAETADGFIARSDGSSKWISSDASRALVHRWRSEEQAIMVGTRTAILDNPELTARTLDESLRAGATGEETPLTRTPLRVVLDRQRAIPIDHHLFDGAADTLVFTELQQSDFGRTRFVRTFFDADVLDQVVEALHERNVLSMIVEGGTVLLQSFIDRDFWDEARVFRSTTNFGKGLPAPRLPASSHVLPQTKKAIPGGDVLTVTSNHWISELADPPKPTA